jgi:hypothetical protein
MGGWAESWRAAMYTLAGRFAGMWRYGETHPDSWEQFSEDAMIETDEPE